MNHQNGTGDDDGLYLLTVSEFIKLAGDRDRKLWTIEDAGRLRMTDGKRSYPLPRLHGGRMPPELVASLLVYFAMESLAPDFALDPAPED